MVQLQLRSTGQPAVAAGAVQRHAASRVLGKDQRQLGASFAPPRTEAGEMSAETCKRLGSRSTYCLDVCSTSSSSTVLRGSTTRLLTLSSTLPGHLTCPRREKGMAPAHPSDLLRSFPSLTQGGTTSHLRDISQTLCRAAGSLARGRLPDSPAATCTEHFRPASTGTR